MTSCRQPRQITALATRRPGRLLIGRVVRCPGSLAPVTSAPQNGRQTAAQSTLIAAAEGQGFRRTRQEKRIDRRSRFSVHDEAEAFCSNVCSIRYTTGAGHQRRQESARSKSPLANIESVELIQPGPPTIRRIFGKPNQSTLQSDVGLREPAWLQAASARIARVVWLH